MATPASDPRQADAELSALLLALDPVGLGGALLRGAGGPVRDQWIANCAAALPDGCGTRKLPAHTPAERLLGGLDVARSLSAGRPVVEKGLLAEAEGQVLILTSAERLEADRAALIAAAMDGDRPRLALVACDEGHDGEEELPRALADRLAFRVATGDLALIGATQHRDLAVIRSRIDGVTVPLEVTQGLCAAALSLGIASLRAVVFASRAARIIAALGGRDVVEAADAATAARLVLAHRAVAFPAPPVPEADDDRAPEPPPPEPDAARGEDQVPRDDPGLAELIMEAVKPALPAGLLAALDDILAGQAQRSGGGAQAAKAGTKRGRPAGSRKGDPRSGARLNLLETLRTGAPWQRLRRKLAPDREGIQVRREDFRVHRFKQRHESTAVFVVDASGSAALQRMAEAKGAVELILADCYIRRDRIALIAFRGRKAEVLLPPTRSLQRARRSLSDLPGGGGTPLASAIDAASAVADQVRRGGGVPLLVFLTDGRGNMARDGTADRAAALRDTIQAAQALRTAEYRSMVIDISPAPGEAARQLARTLGATYLPLPHADAARISRSVSAAMKPGGAAP